MRHFGRDLRYSWRGLARSPLFTIVALVSIALGIGANTAIFALVDEVLLRLIPVPHPEQLVLFTGPRNHYGSNSGGNVLSFPMYEDFRDNFVDRGGAPALTRITAPLTASAGGASPRIFSGMFARRTVAMNIGVPGKGVETERVPGELVSGTYFQTLGVGAAIGRVLLPEDDQARGSSFVAVLSYDYWRNRFGSDPAIVGQRITINNYPFTIVGVSQAGFDGVDIGYVPNVRVPIVMKAQMTPNWDDVDNRRSRWANVFARMKPGVTTNLAPTLKDQVGAVVGGSAGVRFRKSLVVAQVTVSVLLLVGAGLFIRSLRNLRLLDLGLKTDNLIALNVSPTLSGYTSVRAKLFEKQIAERIAALPGVANIAYAQIGVLEGNEWDSSMSVEGYDAKPGENMNPYCNAVSPGYFRTMGIPLVAGRDFDERDARFVDAQPVPNTPPAYSVTIVNESYAKHYFGNRNPIGRHIGFGMNPGTKTPIEIVGIVKDAKYTGVRDEIPRQVFFPFLQNDFAGGAVMYVRTSSPPDVAFGSIRQIVRQIDPNIPIYNLRTLEHQIDTSLLNDRIIATLSTAFGLLATLLAVVGLYGVMAYTVARRTREIGVRMALGAGQRDVVWLVMREVLVLVGGGIAIGLVAAFAAGTIVASQLYGVTASDPLTIAAAAAVLAGVALVAGYVPARRAMRVNPVLALRYE